MKLELIYSFNNKQQEIVVYPFVSNIMDTKENFVKFILSVLSKEEINDLYKISCCVYCEGEELNEPKWYEECNGKFYFENGKLQVF